MIDFKDTLVIGISSRALFDLEEENKIYEKKGVSEYRSYQRKNENKILKPGTSFHLVEALLSLNKLAHGEDRLVEVIIMSTNSPETGIRVLNSVEHYGLDITRSAFTAGEDITRYIEAFQVDLFLSRNPVDVKKVIDSKITSSALILDPPKNYNPDKETVRIAFDADAVIFSDESERIYKEKGLDEFKTNEKTNQNNPMNAGPHEKLLKMLSKIQKRMNTEEELTPLRLAIVTARNSPSHMRVINTLRSWEVYIDEAFFLGGMKKSDVLKAFNAHIFFDDQLKHLDGIRDDIPSGQVPYESDSPLNNIK